MDVGVICLIVGLWGLANWMIIGFLQVGSAKKVVRNMEKDKGVDGHYE